MKTIPLQANIVQGSLVQSSSSGVLSKVLGGLFVLAIIGVIILAFIAYRGKIIGDDDEDFSEMNSETQTYY